jgi:putative membrane protein
VSGPLFRHLIAIEDRMRIPLFITAVLVAGCAKTDKNVKEAANPPMDSIPAQSPPAAPATQAVTDPQIAAIVVAANDVDIAAGRLAATRAHNPEVRVFAKQMITDHSMVNKQAKDLVTKLNVTPESNPTSEQLTKDGERNRQALQEKRDTAFDRAYIDNEVTYHQAVLTAIDSTLLPNAQNAELKTLLQQTRPAIAGHLAHAQKIQSSLAH